MSITTTDLDLLKPDVGQDLGAMVRDLLADRASAMPVDLDRAEVRRC